MSNFIFDIDGTLRNFQPEANIDPKLYSKLIKLKEKNRLFAVTGRTFNNFRNFLVELSLTTGEKERLNDLFEVIFCEDGHLYYNTVTKKCLVGIKALNQLKKVRTYVHRHYRKFVSKYSIDLSQKDLVGEIIITIQAKEDKTIFGVILDKYIREHKLDMLRVNALTHGRLSVSVSGVGKRTAIESYPIDLSDTYFFCDEKNDLELAIKVKKSGGKIICPDNAIGELKNIADYVSKEPYSYGVVDFLSRYFKNSSN